jgi:hypothetical protein
MVPVSERLLFENWEFSLRHYIVSGRKLLISEAVRDVEGGGETLNGWF